MRFRPSSWSGAQARSIRDPDLLGNWLYGVALRTARKAKSRSVRSAQQSRGQRHARFTLAARRCGRADGRTAGVLALAREQAEALYSEIDRLPRPFRLPIVLHYFEGLSSKKPHAGFAARPAPCAAAWHGPATSCGVDSTRRGVALSAAAVASALASRSASACVSSSAVRDHSPGRDAIRGRTGRRRGMSASAMALAQEVLRSMLVSKLKTRRVGVLFARRGRRRRGFRRTGTGSSGWKA